MDIFTKLDGNHILHSIKIKLNDKDNEQTAIFIHGGNRNVQNANHWYSNFFKKKTN